jgi:ABC-type transporter MlaC component
MLSTGLKQEIITQRIKEVVSILMEEEPLFKEDFNVSEIIEHLVNLFGNNLLFEEFKTISDQELKEQCRFIMATEMLGKMGKEFTDEQMLTFEEAIKRK